MSELLDLRYQFDPTGHSTDNLIIDELHTVSQSGPALIIPREGLMYTPGFTVRRASSNVPLIQNTDFHFISLDEFITAKTGIETASAIQFDKAEHFGDFVITYQAVGGYEGRFNRLVQDLIDAIERAKDADVEWVRVKNKPAQYPPEYHNHELISITGWEKFTVKLHELKEAILDTHSLGSSALSLSQADSRILALIAEMQREIQYLNGDIADILERMKRYMEFDIDFGELGRLREWADRDVFFVSSIDLQEKSNPFMDFGEIKGPERNQWDDVPNVSSYDMGELSNN